MLWPALLDSSASSTVVFTLQKSMIADRVRPQLQAIFCQAQSICVLTGQQLATDSGVPRFDGKAEPWQGQNITELLSQQSLYQDPVTVWQWLEHRRTLIAGLTPGLAYQVLAGWEGQFQDLTLITQTVDGLHSRAGNRHILELAGNIWRVRCQECHRKLVLTVTPLDQLPPRCPQCNVVLRPDINLKGESPAPEVFKYAELAIASCDLLLMVGVDALFAPAVSLLLQANHNGLPVIEINCKETEITLMCNETLVGDLGELLSQFSVRR
jgi:NAD-dependent deacetylase